MSRSIIRRRAVRWTSVIAAILSVAALAACASSTSGNSSSPSSTTGRGPSIWYVNPLFSYGPWSASSTVFKQQASADGYSATVVGNNQINIPQQITDIKQAEASGAKGIITCDLDPSTFQSTITSAEKHSTVMVSLGCVDNASSYSIGTNNVTYGQYSAQVIAQKAGPDAQIAVVGTNLSTPNQAAQYNAFVAYAKAHYPKMKILTFQSDQSDPTKAAQQISALPTAYPSMNALWIIEGFAPSVAPRALAEAGKKPGQIFVLGIDTLPATLSAVKDGWVSETLAQCYFWASPFAAKLIKAKLAGHGPAQRSYSIPVIQVGKSQLPFNGCPSSVFPKV